MVKIRLKNLTFYGYHGVFNEEKSLGQQFIVNLEMISKNIKGCITDRLDDTIDYTKAYSIIKDLIEKKPGNHLLEYIGYSIAKKILKNFKQIDIVKVIITKERVPFPGITTSEVEVICKKEEMESF